VASSNLHSIWDGLLGGSETSDDVLRRVGQLMNDKVTLGKVLSHRDSIMQDPLDRAAIYRHACLFRDATSFDESNPSMQSFPTECCHHAVKLMGLYFFDHDFGTPQIISGKHPTHATVQHHWVRLSGYDVDISGDQPGLDRPDVVVASNSYWHQNLNGQPLPSTSFDSLFWNAIRARPYHGPIYLRILANIPHKPRIRNER
jgi:hypothetical protein